MTNNINEQKDEVAFENVASLEHLNRKKHDDNRKNKIYVAQCIGCQQYKDSR
jgi:hypothetical protein